MRVQTMKLTTIAHMGTLVGREKSRLALVESSMPRAMPSTPPVTAMMMDSMRNWLEMSMPRAPTDMRSPISLVRSVTLTSMMFMMPMPATRSEKAAATTRMRVTVSMVLDMVSIISCCERMVKSSSASSLSLCCWRSICVSSLIASSVISSVRAEQLMLERYVWAETRFMTVV